MPIVQQTFGARLADDNPGGVFQTVPLHELRAELRAILACQTGILKALGGAKSGLLPDELLVQDLIAAAHVAVLAVDPTD